MAKYADVNDCVDPALTVSELNLTEADTYVDALLAHRGITPAEISAMGLPNQLLTAIAANWAKRLAAIEGAMGDDSVLIAKAGQYQANAKLLAEQLSRVALGLANEASASGYGSIELGRN